MAKDSSDISQTARAQFAQMRLPDALPRVAICEADFAQITLQRFTQRNNDRLMPFL
jgi:hypothetical protein